MPFGESVDLLPERIESKLRKMLKVVLLGPGRHGKTSLWKALVDQPFDPNEDSAHGTNRAGCFMELHNHAIKI